MFPRWLHFWKLFSSESELLVFYHWNTLIKKPFHKEQSSLGFHNCKKSYSWVVINASLSKLIAHRNNSQFTTQRWAQLLHFNLSRVQQISLWPYKVKLESEGKLTIRNGRKGSWEEKKSRCRIWYIVEMRPFLAIWSEGHINHKIANQNHFWFHLWVHFQK